MKFIFPPVVLVGLLCQPVEAEEPTVAAKLGDGNAFSVDGLFFSPDEKWLIFGAGGAKSFETKNWEKVKIPDEDLWTSPQAISGDGKVVVGGTGNVACLFDLPAWSQHGAQIQLKNQFTTIGLSHDGKLMAIADGESAITLIDTSTGATKGALADESKAGKWALSSSFSSDDKTLAVGYRLGEVALWDVANHKIRRAFKPKDGNAQWCIGISPDGKLVVTVDLQNNIVLLDAGTLKPKVTIKGHTEEIHSMCFDPTGKQLVSCSFDKTVRVWDVATGKEKAQMSGPSRFTRVAVSSDGKLLAAGNIDQTVVVWNLPQAK